MPVPVFVLDAAGQPLMPVAAAHARKLLAKGKAERIPHPTITIIRLGHRVEQPALRPILVGVITHKQYPTTELFFLAAGTSTVFSLLYVVLDHQELSSIIALPPSRSSDWSPNHLDPIASVLDSLRRFLPINLIVYMQSSSEIPDGLHNWVAQSGIQEMNPQSVNGPQDADMLYAALAKFVADPQRAAQKLVAIPRPYISTRFLAYDTPPTIGVVEEIGIVGLVADANVREEKTAIIQIAITASGEGISWQSLMIPASMAIRQWSGGGIAIIPVTQLSQTVRSLVLW